MSTPRPSRYRRAGVWRTALRRLATNGWSDAQIAECLSELTDEAILALEERGWNYQTIEQARQPEARTPAFTRDQVIYHRRDLGLPAGRSIRQKLNLYAPGREWACLCDYNTIRANLHAAHRGWGHLPGRGPEIVEYRHEGRTPEYIAARLRWTVAMVLAWLRRPWDLLRRTESDVLSTLADDGPQTWRQIAGRLGCSRNTNGRTWIGLLWEKALIQHRGRVYELAEGVRRAERTGRRTSIELLFADVEQ